MQTQFDRRENNIDFIRLALAVLVIFSHSYPLAAGPAVPDPLARITNWQPTLGGLAVGLFFILSGFLITASYERSATIGSYLLKRIRRIYPAFLVVSLLMLLVELPLSGGHLVPGPRIAQASHVILQAVRLREFDHVGSFLTNPQSNALNGSAWSLPFEFWCYLFTVVLGLSGLLRSRWLLLALLALCLAVSTVWAAHQWRQSTPKIEWLFGSPFHWAEVLPMYVAGTVFYRLRSRLSLRLIWIAAAVALLLAGNAVPYGYCVSLPVAGAYLVLVLAYHPAIRLHSWSSRFGDLSYGTYLYAYPVQQLLMRRIGHPISPWALFALATPITLACAAASWYGVERWFLQPSRIKHAPTVAASSLASPEYPQV